MSIIGSYTKQSGEVESYSIDYSQDLDDGDQIVSATATVDQDQLLLINYCVFISVPGDQRSRVMLAAGTDGVKYKITVTAKTQQGRTLEDEFYVKIKEY